MTEKTQPIIVIIENVQITAEQGRLTFELPPGMSGKEYSDFRAKYEAELKELKKKSKGI